MEKINTMRYVAMTTKGKPLFIQAEQKAINSQGMVKTVYKLTEDLLDASKTLNRVSANTLIQDYLAATQSTKEFAVRNVATTFELLEESDEDGGN